MAVSLNCNWKVPLGYFLIGGFAASERANLVETCLLKLSDVGVKTVSLTCDGPSCNQSMVKLLGAKLDVNDLDPSFTHPGNKNEKIHVILDVCHMLKLVRNTLATQKIIIDGSGGKIRWELIEELHKIQDEEGLRLGNNLRGAHIQWAKQKMKVDLAAQTISVHRQLNSSECSTIYLMFLTHETLMESISRAHCESQTEKHGHHFWKKQCNTSVL